MEGAVLIDKNLINQLNRVALISWLGAMPSAALSSPSFQFQSLLTTLRDFKSDAPSPCGETLRKDWVGRVASDWYLWNGELDTAADPDEYSSSQAFLNALTAPLAADGRDPGFSYVTTRQLDESQFTSGAYVGFGFRSGVGAENRLYLADVFEGGPAWNADFRRGMEILAIDTGDGFETWADLLSREAAMEAVFGPSKIAVSRGFRLLDSDGLVKEAYVKKDE